MANVLIIDDDLDMCLMLTTLVVREGHQSIYKLTLDAGLKEAADNSFDVIFLDINMPDGNGLDFISNLHRTPSKPEIIIITGHADMDGAEIALKSGAWDYIQKSDSPKKLILPLQRVIKYREGLEQTESVAIALKLGGIIGSSQPIEKCLDIVAQASNNPVNVLITGDTGTGKELFAKAIHTNSSRSDNHFIVVDCAALPETLVESILFGHEKGAFTGADSIKEGLVADADGGTLFLDEVGELPLSIQKSFLRVLQEHVYRPVGGKKENKSDFRLIAATNRNLDEMIQAGTFRNDLLYRLKALTLELPALKDRIEDINDITTYHVKKICDRYKIKIKGISPDFIDMLKSYSWPGNIRELVNLLETAINAAVNSSILLPIHLPTGVRLESMRNSINKGLTEDIIASDITSYREMMDLAEKDYFMNLLLTTKGDIKKSCQMSGLSRSRVYGLLKKHGLSKKIYS